MKTRNCLKAFVLILILLWGAFHPVSAQQQPKGLLWEISGKGLSKPAYLFGSMHIYDTAGYQLPQLPFDLLDKVDKLYLELDLGKIDLREMMEGMYISDSTAYIDKQLDALSMEKMRRFVQSAPLSSAMGNKLYAIKPMLLISMLTGSAGKAASVDFELYKAANSRKLPVGGLETVREEMEALKAVSLSSQMDMLRLVLDQQISPAEMLKRMTTSYVQQDIEQLLYELNYNTSSSDGANDALLVKRNIVMADRIDSLLKNEHPLIAVGAAHLGAGKGLIVLLKQKGYTLTNIPFSIKKAHE
ncbi:hypothetical protein SAMN05428949_4501 [Chitinophaga sp. YR627]|uniref:TraB/GumN family protein n=1 Tax=Chitinophaga sp. YR627 TaxID=1881041 RepID=UPI0008F423AE|nr:TraB/GumN family protein [Chitinophaga sp. YR627]SFO21555.1 hypothetical protein SAMN05428949_4501 [Chitinophaga sp. YR627]